MNAQFSMGGTVLINAETFFFNTVNLFVYCSDHLLISSCLRRVQKKIRIHLLIHHSIVLHSCSNIVMCSWRCCNNYNKLI